jgi:hypothetical protein
MTAFRRGMNEYARLFPHKNSTPRIDERTSAITGEASRERICAGETPDPQH